ncbi:hypothetical protein F2P44_21515 [Massilia sp. CCM 8695]|uniref:Uncharacterized protein n=1 Tax=Massilia frigida TaxID=2609281 RepID=A0ABX0NJK3_9BURK|nr:hypothetical protein [Massilia frigida]NHZ81835.1 hypothetical protein [Massilia frigida]
MSKIPKNAPLIEATPLADPVPPVDVLPAAEEALLVEAPPLVRARVLVGCALGKPGDVIEIDAALAETMTTVLDTAPAAVTYAESIKKV